MRNRKTLGITGATGLIGSHLAKSAQESGWRVVAFSRRPAVNGAYDEIRNCSRMAATDFSGLDVLVHLAGEPLFAMWTRKRKEAIRASRIAGTRALVERLSELPSRPHTLICASGISIYGDRGDEVLTEASAIGGGFLADVCRDWEAAAREATGFSRVVNLRITPVFGRGGGMVPILRKVFRAGIGGRLGSGRQWMSWIHIVDLVQLILFVARQESLSGPVIAAAPEPVTNREFTAAIADAVRRPAVFPVPAWLLRALPGGMGGFVLDSHRGIPAAAANAGFTWQYGTVREAARDVLT